MKLVAGSKKFTIKPYLIEMCGMTENVGFRVYDEAGHMQEFKDLQDMGEWFASVVIDETLEEEPEK